MNGWQRTTLAVAAASLVVAGCGRSADEGAASGGQASAVAEGKAQGTIKVWAMGAEGEKLNLLGKDFMAENPDVTVKVTPVPWDAAHDKIATAIAGGTTPDVSLIGTTWMGEFADTGAVDATPTDLIDPSSFFEGAWNTTEVGDTSYGVPWYVETRLIYYRTDLAKKAGVTKPPGNWDELKAMVKGMQEKGGAKWGISLPAGGTGSWQTFLPFAWQNGADVMDGDSFTLDTAAVKGAMEYYKSYFDEKLTPTALEPGALESGFIAGDIGSFISGPWHMSILADQGGAKIDGKWAVAHMPEKEAATSFVGGGDLVVFKDAENRDAAWKFVEYLTRPEVQQKWYQTVSDLPSVKSAWEGGKLAEDPQLKLFGEQLDDAKSPPSVPTWEQVASVMDRELEKVTKGREDIDSAAKTIQSKAESIGTGA